MIKIALVGAPNVGKSVLFNYLSGMHAIVSNYPGTTVEILKGYCNKAGQKCEFIDTPGMYSLLPISEEERISRQVLIEENSNLVIHVIDGKHIRRMLNFTIELIEAGFNIVLNVNMMDEARKLGIHIDTKKLADLLHIPVVPTAAVKKIGLNDLEHVILNSSPTQSVLKIEYSAPVEEALLYISEVLQQEYGISKRMVAMLLLSEDQIIKEKVKKEDGYIKIMDKVKEVTLQYPLPLNYIMAMQRQEVVNKLCNMVVRHNEVKPNFIFFCLEKWTREPVTGFIILGSILFFAMYQFIGKFGAGFLVNILDTFYLTWLHPFLETRVYEYIPQGWVQDLLMGKYGIISMGLRYAVVIVMPIVGSFFLVFAFLEDSGYLPRLAMLVDWLFKYFGLNGRAVIPFTLSFGCGTMGVVVTRTLETYRERILATFLMALTIPCSAQLGVIMSLLANDIWLLSVWATYITFLCIILGLFLSRIFPGEKNAFYMEIPMLRIPLLSNILSKVARRMTWYFMEIIPIFILTSMALWWMNECGLLETVRKQIYPLIIWLNLPSETADVFLYGFLRRDYGAAGLYDMKALGLLSSKQMLVTCVILTLFIPCIAQMAVMIKERGLILSLLMAIVIIGIAFFAGAVLSWILEL